MVEPMVRAKEALSRGRALRWWMYQLWATDNYLTHPELLDRVIMARGGTVACGERYLLILRYYDSIATVAAKVTEFMRMSTLGLCDQLAAWRREGTWVDPGEPSFYDVVPEECDVMCEEAGFMILPEVAQALTKNLKTKERRNAARYTAVGAPGDRPTTPLTPMVPGPNLGGGLGGGGGGGGATTSSTQPRQGQEQIQGPSGFGNRVVPE